MSYSPDGMGLLSNLKAWNSLKSMSSMLGLALKVTRTKSPELKTGQFKTPIKSFLLSLSTKLA